ncbi:MAG: hypothetical protein BWX61_00892 [Bacteroidetes bacterium ADurb.Bin035]|nr:MAG: hypothetical protein BWX61_00892 [Bacteroidetes bacterium ADurb.Bin035]
MSHSGTDKVLLSKGYCKRLYDCMAKCFPILNSKSSSNPANIIDFVKFVIPSSSKYNLLSRYPPNIDIEPNLFLFPILAHNRSVLGKVSIYL